MLSRKYPLKKRKLSRIPPHRCQRSLLRTLCFLCFELWDQKKLYLNNERTSLMYRLDMKFSENRKIIWTSLRDRKWSAWTATFHHVKISFKVIVYTSGWFLHIPWSAKSFTKNQPWIAQRSQVRRNNNIVIIWCSIDSCNVDAWSTPLQESHRRSLVTADYYILPWLRVLFWQSGVETLLARLGIECTTLDLCFQSGACDLSVMTAP